MKHINSFNMMKKVNNFRTYFFPLVEVDVSFWNYWLSTTLIFIKPKVDFLANKSLGKVQSDFAGKR